MHSGAALEDMEDTVGMEVLHTVVVAGAPHGAAGVAATPGRKQVLPPMRAQAGGGVPGVVATPGRKQVRPLAAALGMGHPGAGAAASLLSLVGAPQARMLLHMQAVARQAFLDGAAPTPLLMLMHHHPVAAGSTP